MRCIINIFYYGFFSTLGVMSLYMLRHTFIWKNQSINLFFFFDEFGSKRTLLGILVVFDSFRLDLKLFWFGFVVDLGLYGN